MPGNAEAGIVLDQPRTAEQRRDVARQCCEKVRYTMPCVVDDMSNSVDAAYAAWPERLFIVGADGRIAYAGGRGPWGYKPREVERWLRAHLPTARH